MDILDLGHRTDVVICTMSLYKSDVQYTEQNNDVMWGFVQQEIID